MNTMNYRRLDSYQQSPTPMAHKAPSKTPRDDGRTKLSRKDYRAAAMAKRALTTMVG